MDLVLLFYCSKHLDLVTQHHTQGNTFELIAKHGDSSVPVHPDDTLEVFDGDVLKYISKSFESFPKLKCLCGQNFH
ncbi:hypothetical protein AQUCO_10100013v1 [Aquilegia coerulea]|uniref:Uncharacterized protein n=1 Tax=Aquilegia coerulea TaxID=218851 RepID=A0A2G5C423_AQUCA|nr:hypothetical protein AQUCO_10100013v1 [Aquilegia coerulea]